MMRKTVTLEPMVTMKKKVSVFLYTTHLLRITRELDDDYEDYEEANEEDDDEWGDSRFRKSSHYSSGDEGTTEYDEQLKKRAIHILYGRASEGQYIPVNNVCSVYTISHRV